MLLQSLDEWFPRKLEDTNHFNIDLPETLNLSVSLLFQNMRFCFGLFFQNVMILLIAAAQLTYKTSFFFNTLVTILKLGQLPSNQ